MDALVNGLSVTPLVDDQDEVFRRIGRLTRQLHDALRELGYDIHLQGVVGAIPDARTRLDYIARLLGEAAEKVLNAVEGAQAVQQRIDADLARLAPQWRALAGMEAWAPPELVRETAAFFAAAREGGDTIREHLSAIMMAQDFHDLTGQVLRRIAGIATHLEEQLVTLLVETTPTERRVQAVPGMLEGPVVNGARPEVVTSQEQVDDLLAELGF